MYRRLKAPSAFTLIELLLVLALLVVIASFTVMTLDGSVLRSKLRKSVEQVRTAWCDARLQAVSGGQRLAFTCMVGGRDFRLSPVDNWLPANEEGQQSQSVSGQLPEGIVFRSLEAASNTAVTGGAAPAYVDEGQWSQPVVFNPDGTSYDALLVLEEESGKQVQVSLRGITCTAESADVPSPRELR